ncbi:MAG: gatB [Gemmatimonadetes bacterium]|nr:gatB [Gemmatimonadota bacterium]
MSTAGDWELVVGLEVHVQLKTRTKLFCGCLVQFGAQPNANTCPVCLALPGALPVANAHAVELATRASLALGCTLHPMSIFARKNYFYPDSPKGYQISQFDQPLATDGFIDTVPRGDFPPVRIGITRVHMEEDAGKSIHDRFPGVSAIDLNRSGTPLVEIVSEPDIRSAEQAGSYLRELKLILEYVDVSDVSMEEGSLRVDANVSARRRGATTLGTKTEIKNLNSFSGVERAIDVEFARHVSLLEAGEPIVQQTMLWDGVNVRPTRSKEGSHDYRYFPEPDLPPLVLEQAWIDRIRDGLTELPAARRRRFTAAFGLSAYDVDVLTSSPRIAEYFETLASASGEPKTAANWVMGDVLAQLKQTGQDIADFPVAAAALGDLLRLVRDGTVTLTSAKRVFAQMIVSGDAPLDIANREGLIKVDDDSQLSAWIKEVLAEMPDEAARFRGGEKRLQGVLIGAVMKKSKGRADPKMVSQLVARLGT